jgi:hypothetical protein
MKFDTLCDFIKTKMRMRGSKDGWEMSIGEFLWVWAKMMRKLVDMWAAIGRVPAKRFRNDGTPAGNYGIHMKRSRTVYPEEGSRLQSIKFSKKLALPGL